MDKKRFYSDLREEEKNLLNEERDMQEQLDVINDKIKAVQLLMQHYKVEDLTPEPVISNTMSYKIEVPSKIVIGSNGKAKKLYKKRRALTVPAMVLNSLKAIQKGTSFDIATKLIQLYPSVSFEKACADTKHNLSLLSKAEKVHIIERRSGKLGFIYQTLENYS